MKFPCLKSIFFCFLSFFVGQVYAQSDLRIGFVHAERVMRESAPAVRALKKLEKEFEKRDQELQRMERQLQTMESSLERGAASMSDVERRQKERQFNEMGREFQRRKREYQEDRNQRQSEELAAVLERANRVIRQLAEAEKIDLIVQEAVYFNPRIDMTERVLKLLAVEPSTNK